MKPGGVHPRLLGAMLLSGAGGLGLQLTWTRQLSLILGHELPALLSVLTAFFGGLAIGGWAWERLLTRVRFQSHWPAGLELLIGGWAFITAVFLGPVAAGAVNLLPADASGTLQAIVTLPSTWLMLLPATAAMGATVPALLRLLPADAANRTGSGRGLALLYAANTAGAVAGTWGAVLWLQPHLGLRATIGACAACHVAAAALLGRSTPSAAPPLPLTPTVATTSWGLLGQLGVTGLLGIGLELVANRALAPILEGTVYSHAATLGVFLIATAVGSALERARPTDSAAAPLGWLALTTLAAGHALLHVRDWSEFLHQHLPGGFRFMLLSESLIALTVLGAPCLCMGSCLVRLVTEARRAGVGPGTALAWNTAGAALAGPLFGTLLLPALGLRNTLWILAAGYALTRTWHLRGSGRNRSFLIATVLVVLGVGLPADLGTPPPPPGSRWVEWVHGASESVGVSQSSDGHRTLSVQGRFTMGGTASTNAAARQLLLPMAWHPAPRRALLLGVGTGISLGAAACDPSLSAVGVELLPEVLTLQGWFLPHNELAHGSRVIAADARRYLRQNHDRFDLIVGDLFHPSRDGAGALYTREQFASMRDHLAPGGIAVQWLPLYQLDAPVLRSIVGAFLAAFPEAQGFLLRPTLDTPVLGLAGKNGVWAVRESDFSTRVGSGDALRRRQQAAGLGSAESVWGGWLAGPKTLTAFVAGSLASTEDSPSVLFQAPKFGGSTRTPPGTLLLDLVERFAGEGSEFPLAEPGGSWGRRLAAFRSARDEYLRGLAEEDRGDKRAAEAAFLRSARLSPDFTLGYSQLLTRAMLRSKTDPSGTRRMLESLRDARPDQPVANQLLNRLESAEHPPTAP